MTIWSAFIRICYFYESFTYDSRYFGFKRRYEFYLQSDVESWGGRVYKIDPPSPKDIFGGKMNAFFSKHKGEWSALHIHCPHFAPFIAPSAKRAGIKNIFVHCHTTEYSLVGNSRRNQILSLYAKYFIDNRLMCQGAFTYLKNPNFKTIRRFLVRQQGVPYPFKFRRLQGV